MLPQLSPQFLIWCSSKDSPYSFFKNNSCIINGFLFQLFQRFLVPPSLGAPTAAPLGISQGMFQGFSIAVLQGIVPWRLASYSSCGPLKNPSFMFFLPKRSYKDSSSFQKFLLNFLQRLNKIISRDAFWAAHVCIVDVTNTDVIFLEICIRKQYHKHGTVSPCVLPAVLPKKNNSNFSKNHSGTPLGIGSEVPPGISLRINREILLVRLVCILHISLFMFLKIDPSGVPSGLPLEALHEVSLGTFPIGSSVYSEISAEV